MWRAPYQCRIPFFLLELEAWENRHTSICSYDEADGDSPPPSAWHNGENGGVLLHLQLRQEHTRCEVVLDRVDEVSNHQRVRNSTLLRVVIFTCTVVGKIAQGYSSIMTINRIPSRVIRDLVVYLPIVLPVYCANCTMSTFLIWLFVSLTMGKGNATLFENDETKR